LLFRSDAQLHLRILSLAKVLQSSARVANLVNGICIDIPRRHSLVFLGQRGSKIVFPGLQDSLAQVDADLGLLCDFTG
jgi:hypothetical protein